MVRRFIFPLFWVLLSQNAVSSIIPEIGVPSNFNKKNFENYRKNISTAGYGGRSCGSVSFKNFYPPEYIASKIKRPPFNTWSCLFAIDVTHDGYGPGKALPEKVYLDKESEIWKMKKYTLNKESTQRSIEIYGIKSMTELQPLELYNIHSTNARGYAVIDSNISLQEKYRGVRKKLSFCMIRDEAALCGSGSMLNFVDGKEVDFTPYMLKSLETIDMGLEEK